MPYEMRTEARQMKTVDDRANLIFKPRDSDDMERLVCRSCENLCMTATVIPDQPPLHLVLESGFTSISLEDKNYVPLYKLGWSFTLAYYNNHCQRREAEYEFKGAIKGNGSHFTVNWYGAANEWFDCDGARRDQNAVRITPKERCSVFSASPPYLPAARGLSTCNRSASTRCF